MVIDAGWRWQIGVDRQHHWGEIADIDDLKKVLSSKRNDN